MGSIVAYYKIKSEWSADELYYFWQVVHNGDIFFQTLEFHKHALYIVQHDDMASMSPTSCDSDIGNMTYQITKDEESLVVDVDWWSPDPPVHSCSVASGNLWWHYQLYWAVVIYHTQLYKMA